MFGLGYQELLLILVIVLVLFGGSKLPDLAKSLGKSMKEFKKGIAAEPEEDSGSSTPARSATVTSTGPWTCSSCQSPMEVAWAHCPRCDDRGAGFDSNSAEVVRGARAVGGMSLYSLPKKLGISATNEARGAR